tara:strand:+ start:606 stop:1241 length:636 start_codon:yes stop_codon:yes gene_type:complete
MAKRTYTTEEAGPASTNKFVQRTYTPTKVVTGAETKLASVQPNLTGKRRLPEPAPDGDSQTAVDPTPLDVTTLSDKALTNVAKSGFPGGFFGPGAVMTGIASAVIPGAAFLAAAGRGANMYNARQEIKARLTTPGLRTSEEEMIVDPPGRGMRGEGGIAQEMKNRNQRVTLADRGYGVGGDGQGDAVGAHPDTDDLGPDSGQGDTEATWGG